MQERFASIVSNNGEVVYKDVPRLVHRTRVFTGVPQFVTQNPSTSPEFTGVKLNEQLLHPESKESSFSDDQRRRVLVARLVATLSRLLALQTEDNDNDDGTREQQEADYDLPHQFPLQEVKAQASNGGPLWAILQGVNQSVIFPAVAALHRRLADGQVTSLPLLDKRAPDAWTVDIFLSPQASAAIADHTVSEAKADTSTEEKTKESKSSINEATTNTDDVELQDSRPVVVVRHKRWMRSMDPQWPFEGLWYLDVKYFATDTQKLQCRCGVSRQCMTKRGGVEQPSESFRNSLRFVA